MEYNKSTNRLHGRKKLYKLSDEKKTLLDDILPKFIINIDSSHDYLSDFSHKKEILLEIGFGYGEHLAFQANNNPNIGLIGAEPFLNGITNLLKIIVEKNIRNIKIYNHDALTLIKSIKPDSISIIYILFPDPWPKANDPGPISAKTMSAPVSRPGESSFIRSSEGESFSAATVCSMAI